MWIDKITLYRIRNQNHREVLIGLLTEQQRLTTLFCEVDGIVNSRPLTKGSDAPKDEAALTPSDPITVTKGFTVKMVAIQTCLEGDVHHRVEMFWRRYIREYIPL